MYVYLCCLFCSLKIWENEFVGFVNTHEIKESPYRIVV